jgi:uncharacterized protein (DUF2126 family)/transglutaminase-like putative cysteine protease
MRPAPHSRTPIVSYSLKVTPADHFINWQQDPYGNYLARLVFPKQTREFSVEVDLVAEMTVINPFDFFVESGAEYFPFEYGELLTRELAPYLIKLPLSPKLGAFVEECRKAAPKEIRTVDYLVMLNQRVQQAISYVIRLEPGIQTPEETLTCLSGSCRDSAWLLVQVMRNLGIAARFVSGYLVQLVADVKPLDGPEGPTADFTDLHAWVEAYVPGAGWIGLDPTSGLLASEGHIPLAATAEPSSAAAVTGFFSYDDEEVTKEDPEVGDHDPREKDAKGKNLDEFEFAMSVRRVHEDPRVTKPYTSEQWSAIRDLGHRVDADLERGDVRLTMGGEPTFVSMDDFDAAEWNTDALGPKKYERADKLIRKLRDRFGKGGFLHHGQGKWYPGESLPRWATRLYWRKDGIPIWHDPTLVADEFNIKRPATERDARQFITVLAERLAVNPRFVQPGFEDVWYYLWKERRLPTNVDPFDSKLEEEEERVRLCKIFERGLDTVVGFAIPLRRRHFTDGTADWVSGPWFFRPERMYLIPGDSPMGYRLPLNSIPWVSPEDYPHIFERDPLEARSPLPERQRVQRERQMYMLGAMGPGNPPGFMEQVLDPDEGKLERRSPVATMRRRGTGGGGGEGEDDSYLKELEEADKEIRRSRGRQRDGLPGGYGQGESAADVVRTALCTEVRKDVLRVFMPPTRYVEDYLDLVGAIEETADELNIPVLMEGYTPPYDPRINEMKVTPDPGVIEVNTYPTRTWDELTALTEGVYEEARQTRLCAEKFMIDGRHTGTGGGNHIVVGASTPSDSPILRRPDLLKSMLGYWHNHPSLSYLFSGLHIGPTSQAPRVDEARNDQVYELELAFQQVPGPKQQGISPWLVDRIFRNLLIDSTGNTHRAEFCIDKLYAPESASGRLGLLEMRGYEMPPHPQMSLTQHLLLRALVAKFWQEPYEAKLVRWRTEIHDRFLLPHFVEQDLEDVLDDLSRSGYRFDKKWFDPHVEFRFPVHGSVEYRGVVFELRNAIEPWHVLGETPGANSTVRYVDSSVERVQLKVRGMTDPRHVVSCNGVQVPLHPTGTNGEYVAGVRFKAWQPSSALHPTITRHQPLTFDLVDTWNNRSIGGCRYYVSHPGGRSFTTAPVNAYEAESRRAARFYRYGHTPGTLKLIEASPTKEFPLTLDLRRYLS